MAVRLYDGVDDVTALSGGTLGAMVNSGFTLVGVVKPLGTGGPNPIISLESSTQVLAALCYSGSNLQLYSDTDDTFAFVGVTTTSYWIFAVTHASGTNKPRFHAMPFGGAWTHVDGAATIVNKTATVTVVRIGSQRLFNGAVTQFGNFNGATVAAIPSALADLAVEAIGTALTTQSVATAGATNLEDLNQASTATAVTDLVGSSSQTSQTGTTVVTGDDPPGWVFGLSGGGLILPRRYVNPNRQALRGGPGALVERRLPATAAPAEQTVTPGFIASTEQTFAPTFVPGPVTISPGFITSGEQVFAPALNQIITPGFIASGAQLFAPTFVPGPVTVTPGFIASAEQVFAPTVTGQNTLTPGFISSAEQTFTPTLVPGSVTVLPGFISSGAQVFQASLSGGAVIAAKGQRPTMGVG